MEEKKFTSSVERNKAASKTCKRLFPQWSKPPTQGELQRIITRAWDKCASDKNILATGNWWLWIRNLFIENTFSKREKEITMDTAIDASLGKQNIHFVTSRSPELLHAQIDGLGDQSLPRSKRALQRLFEIVSKSQTFLPTQATILFADLVIDNLSEIQKMCDIEKTICENLQKLDQTAREIGFENLNIIRLSELEHPLGKLSSLISMDGTPIIQVDLDSRAKNFIAISTRESVESQQTSFRWTQEQAISHNINLGITMGLVGQSVKSLEPKPIIIHNESFISRGQLNNIFNSPDDPVPVISLRDLLESKKGKS